MKWTRLKVWVLLNFHTISIICGSQDPYHLLSDEEKLVVKKMKLSKEELELAKKPTFTDLWGFVHHWNDEDKHEW